MNNLYLRDDSNIVKVELDKNNLKEKIKRFFQEKEYRKQNTKKSKEYKIKKNDDKLPPSENRFSKSKGNSSFTGFKKIIGDSKGEKKAKSDMKNSDLIENFSDRTIKESKNET